MKHNRINRRETLRKMGQIAYSAPLTMTLLTSKRALAQSPPCSERIEISTVRSDPAGLIPIEYYSQDKEITLICEAKSFVGENLSYTWSTGHAGAIVAVKPSSMSFQSPPPNEGPTTEPIIVTVNDGTCSIEDSIVLSFDDTVTA